MTDKYLPIASILTILKETPPRLAKLTAGLAPARLHTAPSVGAWSANEVLAHLRACNEVWGGYYILTILAQDTPTIKAINPRTWIQHTDYREQAFQAALRAFTEQRSKLLAVLERVCQVVWLLRKLRAANLGKRLLVVLDNARYQRAWSVQRLAKRLHIRLLFLPPYSPNLNLIERFWKLLRKQVLRNTYYATFADFRAAIQRLLANLDSYAEELTTLMTENFHLFGAA